MYIVSSRPEITSFQTGGPPDAPSKLRLIANTNTDVRIGFDPFIEHNAEILGLHVLCEPLHSSTNDREVVTHLTPDSTEFILSNLIERTQYNVTVYAITEEYLNEKAYRDVSHLPNKLPESEWLSKVSLRFETSGYEPTNKLKIIRGSTDCILLEWELPKVYGSTKFIDQILRWNLEHSGEEHRMQLSPDVKTAKIPGRLPSGSYKVCLDAFFSVKINLDDDSNEQSRKESCCTTTESVLVRFHIPDICEQPQLYLTGYTTKTIDLAWNKPNMFYLIDHPEKLHEKLKIHYRLSGYRIDVNQSTQNKLDEHEHRCTLTECQPGDQYKIQLFAQTVVQNEYMDEVVNQKKSFFFTT